MAPHKEGWWAGDEPDTRCVQNTAAGSSPAGHTRAPPRVPSGVQAAAEAVVHDLLLIALLHLVCQTRRVVHMVVGLVLQLGHVLLHPLSPSTSIEIRGTTRKKEQKPTVTVQVRIERIVRRVIRAPPLWSRGMVTDVPPRAHCRSSQFSPTPPMAYRVLPRRGHPRRDGPLRRRW